MAETTYKFVVETSDAYTDAGTNSYVYVQLVSKDGKTETEWRNLDVLFKDDFQVGAIDEFEIQMKDVGLPGCLKIKLENWLNDDDEWLCNYIKVYRGQESVMFPIYSYIDQRFEVLSGEALLPQKDLIPVRKNIRSAEIEHDKNDFPWISVGITGVAKFVQSDTYDELPRIFKRYTRRVNDIKGNRFAGKMQSIVGVLTSRLTKIKSLDDFHKLSSCLEDKVNKQLGQTKSRFAENWKEDEIMGWMLLNGVDPLNFCICKEIPSYFNVTNHDVQHLLRPGKTLQDEMKEGRIYLFDYVKIYEQGNCLVYTDLPAGGKSQVAQSCALLYVNGADQFVPIAIQLKPNDRDYLFMRDGTDDWLLAKMYFRNSGLNTHEWLTHFLHTHLAMEPIAVALFRCLSRCHPVYKLLRSHLSTVSAINAVGRTDLLPATTKVARGLGVLAISSVRYFYQTFELEELNIPKQLKLKGLDPKKLPNYHYGTDMLNFWALVEDYCNSVIGFFYKTDQDVADDFELQDFAKELAFKGVGWEDGNTRGYPEKFTSIKQLVEFCTIVVVTNSGQHAAVNYGQFEMYSYVPACPAIMNLPPHKKGEASYDRIMKSLPNDIQSVTAIAMAYGLSQFSASDEFIGEFREQWFVEEEVLAFQDRFRKNLDDYGRKIDERNAKLGDLYYKRLHPSRVPAAIAI